MGFIYENWLRRASIIILVGVVLATACGGGTSERPTPITSSTTVPLAQDGTKVSPARGITLTADGGAALAIPQGAYNRETVVRIAREADPTQPQSQATVRLVADVYQLEQKTLADLTKPLMLQIPYKADLIPVGASPSALTLVWWDGEVWRDIPSDVDAQAHVVRGQIEHFSEYSVGWSWFKDKAYDATGAIRSFFYAGTHTAGDFTINYATKSTTAILAEAVTGIDAPMSMVSDERPPQADANKNGVPDYVENLGRYLVQSKEAFEHGGPHLQGLTVPKSGTIHVFIADLGYDEKEASGTLGDADPRTTHIRIDNKLSDDQLKNTAAHELFHYWQFSRLYLLTGNAYRWWMEATAAWAMDQAFPGLGLYAHDITVEKPNPPLEGFANIGSRKVSEFYAAASLAKYLEFHYPGFIMSTFDPQNGLRLTEPWHTTFGRILRDQYNQTGFDEVFLDYIASYFYLWDYDKDITQWFGNLGPFALATDHFTVSPGAYQRVSATLSPLSGRLVSILSSGELQPAKLIVRQFGADSHQAQVMAFADAAKGRDRTRVSLPGDTGRTGLFFDIVPDRRLSIDGFGQVAAGGRFNQLHVVAANTSVLSENALQLEIYVLQPPEQVKSDKVGTDRLKISWAASLLPRGEKPEDKGALRGYKIYRQQASGEPTLVKTLDATVPSFEGAVSELAGTQASVTFVVRAVDKYGTESRDSQPVTVSLAVATPTPTPPPAPTTFRYVLKGTKAYCNQGTTCSTTASGVHYPLGPATNPDSTSIDIKPGQAVYTRAGTTATVTWAPLPAEIKPGETYTVTLTTGSGKPTSSGTPGPFLVQFCCLESNSTLWQIDKKQPAAVHYGGNGDGTYVFAISPDFAAKVRANPSLLSQLPRTLFLGTDAREEVNYNGASFSYEYTLVLQ